MFSRRRFSPGMEFRHYVDVDEAPAVGLEHGHEAVVVGLRVDP